MQFFSRIRSGIGAIVPLAQGRALTFRKGAALPEGDTGGPTERPNGASPSGTPSDGVHLDLEKTSLAIEDGLLMVLGPQGDPVPPAAFAAAAADQPLASLALPHGTRVAARRVAVVLEAQARGKGRFRPRFLRGEGVRRQRRGVASLAVSLVPSASKGPCGVALPSPA